MRELTQLSAGEMTRRVRDGEVSVTEIVRAHLERIGEVNPRLNAYIHVDGDRALDAARAKDLQLEEMGLPLWGVPVSVKSSVSVAGFPWECGSKMRHRVRGETDAPLVARLKEAGAIVLGSTNVPEFLMAWETDNALYGQTRSPWDPDYTPGGSSGGEAASIACGMSAGGVGSDGGGSIRVPAHFSGICGLKPTPGRIPATLHFPVSAGPFASLGVVGPMARTVSDVRRLYEVLAGPDPGDPVSAPVPVERLRKKRARQLRIGYFETDGRTPIAPEVRAALRKARMALEEQGFAVEEFRPSGLDDIHRMWWNLFGRAVGALLAPMIRGQESQLSPTFRQFNTYVDRSLPLTRDELMETLLRRDSLRSQLLTEMSAYPVLLCPVAAVAAFRHGERAWEIEGRRVEYLDAWRYSAWFNLTGNPAMSVPIPGVGPRPVGVQLVGRPWEEAAVLAVAGLLEEAVGVQGLAPLD